MKKSATSNPKQNPARHARQQLAGYTSVHHNIVQLLHTARQNTARAVNAFITATYWEIGRHIVEFEQRGADRAAYRRLPAALVNLCPPVICQRPARPHILRNRSLACGWSVRQLDRQINSQFYERTVLQHTGKIPKTIFSQLHPLQQ